MRNCVNCIEKFNGVIDILVAQRDKCASEQVESQTTDTQQLKAEICEHADSYIKECQYDGLESLVVKNFSRWLVRKLSTI